MAFGFSVPLLGSSSLSVPTYACRKGAGFCQAGKRQSRGPGGRSYHRLCMAGRAGGGDRGWGWNGQRRGAHREAGRRAGRGCVCAWLDLEKLPGRKQSWSGGSWPTAGLGRGCPRRVGFWGAQRWVQRRAFRPREALGAGEERGRAQSGAEQSEEGILLLSLFLPPIAMRRVHDELVRLWIVERRR